MNTFDLVKAIRNKQHIEWGPETEKEYVPFLANKAISFDIHGVLLANELNKYATLPKKQQFDFYMHAVQPSKKFVPWVKSEHDDVVDLIVEMYSCNRNKATDIAKILNQTQIEHLRMRKHRMQTGK